jgi:hypothetical protein
MWEELTLLAPRILDLKCLMFGLNLAMGKQRLLATGRDRLGDVGLPCVIKVYHMDKRSFDEVKPQAQIVEDIVPKRRKGS